MFDWGLVFCERKSKMPGKKTFLIGNVKDLYENNFEAGRRAAMNFDGLMASVTRIDTVTVVPLQSCEGKMNKYIYTDNIITVN